MNMFKIKFLLNITFSKLMAFLILISGSFCAYYIKDAGIVYATFGIITALLVTKQVQDGLTERKTGVNKRVNENS